MAVKIVSRWYCSLEAQSHLLGTAILNLFDLNLKGARYYVFKPHLVIHTNTFVHVYSSLSDCLVTSRLEQLKGLVLIKQWVLLPLLYPLLLFSSSLLLLLLIFILILLLLFPPLPISSECMWIMYEILWYFWQKPGAYLGWAVLSGCYLQACRSGSGLRGMHVEPLGSTPGEMGRVGGLTQFFFYVVSWLFINFFLNCS